MRRWMILPIVCLLMTGLFSPALAASAKQVSPDPVEYTFGGQVTLRVDIDPLTPISDAQAFLRSVGDSETYTGVANIQDGEILYYHDLTAEPLRAFSVVEYWFRITPENGEPILSDTFTFFYEDNRFSWQTLASGPISIHWYEGTLDFGQSILNAAEAGLSRASTLLMLPTIQPINIYVYASGMEMQSTLRLGGLRWISGHADPDLGVAVISLPAGPDQRSETERQIPHEVMHLLTYQTTGPAYYSLPIWLKEGLASANESRPNPDYYVILSKAVENDTLISMNALCQTFPQDNTVYLAYAQSDSFVRYLHQQYGQTGIQNLLNSFAAGQGCESAPQSALGLSLTELEQAWRKTALNDNIIGAVLEALLPWGVLLLVALPGLIFITLSNIRKNNPPQPVQEAR